MIVDGKPVKKINYQGKTYLPVVKGSVFSVKITNQSNRRICAVISVDGLSVMNGKNASKDDSGYIIDAWCVETIEGWRRGSEEVAQFEISNKEESYAGKTDRPQNVGVIGVAVYPEKERLVMTGKQQWQKHERIPQPIPDHWPSQPYPYIQPWPTTYCSNTARGISGQSMNCCSQDAGTAYGQSVESHVTTVNFERDEACSQRIVLYYDTVKALRKKGVPIDTHIGTPRPFPADQSDYYCPEP